MWPEYPPWAVTTWLKFEYRLRVVICLAALGTFILYPGWWQG